MKEKLKTFRDLLDTITEKASPKQRRYAQSLLDEIIKYLNIQENQNTKLKAGTYTLTANEYTDTLEQQAIILRALGLEMLDLFALHKNAMNFIIKNRKSLRRHTTINDLYRIQDMYSTYVMMNDREPKDFEEMKNYKICTP